LLCLEPALPDLLAQPFRPHQLAEEDLEQQQVAIGLGTDRPVLQPPLDCLAPGGGDAIEALRGPTALDEVERLGQACRDEAGEHRIDLAAGRRPEVAHAPADEPLEVVAGTLAADEEAQHGRFGGRDLGSL
jgi:hypothetical protein